MDELFSLSCAFFAIGREGTVGNLVPKCRGYKGYLKPKLSLAPPLGPEKASVKLDCGRPFNLKES